MRQLRVNFPAAAAVAVRVTLALAAVETLAALLQLDGAVAGLWLGPVLPGALAAFDHPVVLRAARRDPQHLDPQADQPQRHLGRELARGAPGVAVIDPEATRQAPAGKRLPQRLLDGMTGHVLPTGIREDHRLQEGAAALIDQPQPADLLLAAQPQLF